MAKFEGSGSRVSGFPGSGKEKDEEGKKKNEERKGRGLLSKPVHANRPVRFISGPVWFL